MEELWDGTYEKEFYWLYPPGEPRVKCWPNAGLMNATDGSGRAWKPEDRVRVELSKEDYYAPPAPRTRRVLTLGAVERERELQRAWHPPKDALDLSGSGNAPPSQSAPTLRDRRSARISASIAVLRAVSGDAPQEKGFLTLGDLHQDTQIRVQAKTIGLAQSWSRMNGKRGLCTHKFGLAGGFAECSACGVKRDKVCTHLFGLGGGFDRCSVCGDRRG